MVRRPPTRSSILITIALLLALVGWTWLTFGSATVRALDERLVAPPLDPTSATAQVAAAFALLTWPGIGYAAILGVAGWAFRHRLRQLTIALVTMALLGAAMAELARVLFRRARPETALDLLTATGFSYPAAHLTSTVAFSIALGATFSVSRQSPVAQVRWQVGAGLLVIAVGLDRWLLGAHFISDIVGGALLGGMVATVSLLAAGVRVPVQDLLMTEIVRSKIVSTPSSPPRRAAVIFNPTKVTDWATFRRHVDYELKTRGWQKTLWLETTTDDPGREMTEQAVREGVDLVLGAGGDGTIRVICSGLAGTGVPFGLIPAGTGNLLAKNIGIPLDEAAALDVAFDGEDKAIDLVLLSVDDKPPDHFAVMAGVGIDAVIVEGTDPNLKRAVGSAAYFVSAARHANHPALHATITVDAQPAIKRRAHVIVVGNVGILAANIQLIPGAQADDGILDVLVASPRTVRDWVRLTTQVITRRKREDAQLDRLTGRRVTIMVEERDHYQVDGDTVGECNTMIAEVLPGALTLRVPRARALPANGMSGPGSDGRAAGIAETRRARRRSRVRSRSRTAARAPR
jgi:diacylglycerol kinase (ATP)